jgi:hypothetical protein
VSAMTVRSRPLKHAHAQTASFFVLADITGVPDAELGHHAGTVGAAHSVRDQGNGCQVSVWLCSKLMRHSACTSSASQSGTPWW